LADHGFPVSMIFTSGPREIFAMNPRFECSLHRRDIFSKADRINAAASSPVSDDDVMLKKRSLAARLVSRAGCIEFGRRG
jgi:hypothetical protein